MLKYCTYFVMYNYYMFVFSKVLCQGTCLIDYNYDIKPVYFYYISFVIDMYILTR